MLFKGKDIIVALGMNFNNSHDRLKVTLDSQAACVVGHANYQSYLVHAAVTSGRALRATARVGCWIGWFQVLKSRIIKQDLFKHNGDRKHRTSTSIQEIWLKHKMLKFWNVSIFSPLLSPLAAGTKRCLEITIFVRASAAHGTAENQFLEKALQFRFPLFLCTFGESLWSFQIRKSSCCWYSW